MVRHDAAHNANEVGQRQQLAEPLRPLRHTGKRKHALEISTPYRELHKEDVIVRGAALGVPFELTLSCMNPVRARGDATEVPYLHCGACSKCRERLDVFRGAGMADPAPYAS